MVNLPKNAPRDNNRVTVMMGVSSQTTTINGISYVAGVTPVPIAVDPVTGKVQVSAA
jgi:hypothetical protein